MRKSKFNEISAQFEKYLSEMDRAQTTKEIAEGLEITNSSAYTTLQLMEVFSTVQKVKRRGRYRYFLKGVYDEEQINAMLPPVSVKPIPRRRKSTPCKTQSRSERARLSKLYGKKRASELFAMRMTASSGNGPSALAIIGLTQPEMIEEVLTKDPTQASLREPRLVLGDDLAKLGETDIDLDVGRMQTPRNIKPYATVGFLPKDARRLTQKQTNHLKEQLKFLPRYEKIDRYEIAFAYFSALVQGTYGNVFYFAMSTNPWERVYKIDVDRSIALEKKEPKKRGSIYDPIIDQFLESEHPLVEITVKNRKASYVNTLLNKRIGERGLVEQVKASYVTDWVYLERVE